jgi:hypothetical protein
LERLPRLLCIPFSTLWRKTSRGTWSRDGRVKPLNLKRSPSTMLPTVSVLLRHPLINLPLSASSSGGQRNGRLSGLNQFTIISFSTKIGHLLPKMPVDHYGSTTILASMLPWSLFGPDSYVDQETSGVTLVLPHHFLPAPFHRSTVASPDE